MSGGKPIKLGIVGFAEARASRYAEIASEMDNIVITGVTDEPHEMARCKKAARKLKLKCYDTYEDLLASDVDGVIVCSETSNHRKHIAYAGQAEKHVMCESPLSTNVGDASAIIEVCRRSRVNLYIAKPIKLHPEIESAIKEVKKWDQIVSIKATIRAAVRSGWRTEKDVSGGGVLMDAAVDVLDIARVAAQADADEVYAQVSSKLHNMEVEDTAIVSAMFQNGVFAQIDCLWMDKPALKKGMYGEIVFKGLDREKVVPFTYESSDFMRDKAQTFTYNTLGEDVDRRVLEEFARSFSREEIKASQGEDTLKALEMICASYITSESQEAQKLPL